MKKPNKAKKGAPATKKEEDTTKSPKLSPKLSPKASPKEASKPKKEEKKAKAAPADAAEKAALVKQALAEVEAGLAKQASSQAFVPETWATKYKPSLGPYKKFLKQHPEKFVLVTDAKGDFVIKRPGEAGAVSVPDQMPWQKDLLKAWMCYCKATERPERDLNAFLTALPKGAKAGLSPGSPAQKPAASPAAKAAAAPAGSPKAAPKAASGKKRKLAAKEEAAAATETAKAKAEPEGKAKTKKKKKKAAA